MTPLSRNFQLGAMIVCVAALAGIYFTNRDNIDFVPDDAPKIVVVAPDAQPRDKWKPREKTIERAIVQPLAATTPTLPKSKAEILADLAARGYKLESLAPLQPIENVDGYRVAGIPAAVAFTEHGGNLTMVDVATMTTGPRTNGPLQLDFAEIVGEVATGRPRDTTRAAIAQTMAAIGKTPGRMSCSFGAGKDRFRLQVTRHDGGYSFSFTAE